jgi:hypothetical protein
MAAKTLEKLVADRDAVSDSLNYIKMKIDEHVITAMREVVCDAVMGMTTTAIDDLSEIHTKIRQCIPSDMIPHKAAYNDLLSQCHEYNAILHGIKMKFPTTSNPSGSSSSSVSSHPHEVRLPRLDVPHFDGNLLEWVTFRDMFTSMVGNSTSLSPGQKLAHLKSVLNGEPLRLINSLLICDANYLIAWDALSNRYTNDREYLFAILSRFTGQPNLHHPTSTSLRAMVDITQECIRSLAVLAIPMDKGLNAFIMFLTTNKLDATSRGLWEQRLMDTSIRSLEDLLKFVEQRARALSAESSVYPRSHPQQQQSKPEERKRVMNAHNNINKENTRAAKSARKDRIRSSSVKTSEAGLRNKGSKSLNQINFVLTASPQAMAQASAAAPDDAEFANNNTILCSTRTGTTPALERVHQGKNKDLVENNKHNS